MLDVSRIFLYHIIYAFIGWICEVIYCSFAQKKLVNRGFLYGPLCPIYGYGALIAIVLYQIKDLWYLVAILGFLLPSCLEYLTSFIMEKIFNMRWWDYSTYKFNINGRVCLKNSLMFFIMTMLMVYLIHPLIEKVVLLIKVPEIYYLATIIFAIYTIDTVFSILRAIHFKEKFKQFAITINQKIVEAKDELKIKFEHSKLKKTFDRYLDKFPSLRIKNKEEIDDNFKKKPYWVKAKEYLKEIYGKKDNRD